MVLDASVLIAHLDAGDVHHDAARELLLGTADELALSVLTLAEVLVGPARSGALDRAEEALEVLGLTSLVVDDARALAELRAGTRLAMPDCCVVLAAERGSASLATFDGRLAEAARGRGLVVHGR